MGPMKKFLEKIGGPKKDGAPALLGKTVQVGLSQVRVEALLGEGGFACIYKVRDVNTGQLYALKHLRLQADAEALVEVQKEAKTMAKLRGHPNVLRLHAVAFAGPKGAETDGFMLLDYCYTTLIDQMQTCHFNLDDATVLEVFYCVCQGVAHMHRQKPPMAHRDLKAENVLKLAEGQWVLCDFGSTTTRAKVYETTLEISEEEENIRRTTTPAYRAPEMWDLFSRQLIDTKADIWALGVLLYVLAFGKLPFQGDSKLQILYGKYDMPLTRTVALRTLIKGMLTPNPAERPDIAQVLAQLEDVRKAAGVRLPPQPPVQPSRSSSSASAGGSAAQQQQQAAPQPHPGRTSVAAAVAEPAQAYGATQQGMLGRTQQRSDAGAPAGPGMRRSSTSGGDVDNVPSRPPPPPPGGAGSSAAPSHSTSMAAAAAGSSSGNRWGSAGGSDADWADFDNAPVEPPPAQQQQQQAPAPAPVPRPPSTSPSHQAAQQQQQQQQAAQQHLSRASSSAAQPGMARAPSGTGAGLAATASQPAAVFYPGVPSMSVQTSSTAAGSSSQPPPASSTAPSYPQVAGVSNSLAPPPAAAAAPPPAMAPPAAPQLQPQLQRVSSAAGVPAAGSPRHSRANSSSSAAVEADSGGQAFKEQVLSELEALRQQMRQVLAQNSGLAGRVRHLEEVVAAQRQALEKMSLQGAGGSSSHGRGGGAAGAAQEELWAQQQQQQQMAAGGAGSAAAAMHRVGGSSGGMAGSPNASPYARGASPLGSTGGVAGCWPPDSNGTTSGTTSAAGGAFWSTYGGEQQQAGGGNYAHARPSSDAGARPHGSHGHGHGHGSHGHGHGQYGGQQHHGQQHGGQQGHHGRQGHHHHGHSRSNSHLDGAGLSKFDDLH